MHGLKEFLNFISFESGDFLASIVEKGELNGFLKQENNWNVEKIALFLHLQTVFHNANARDSGIAVPKVLSKEVLTVSSLQGKNKNVKVGTLLKETSTVVHPRCHMVWESVWSFLCEEKVQEISTKKKKRSGQNKEKMLLRESSIIGNNTPNEILLSLVNSVIVDGLLKESESNNITHERRALAMTLVHQLCQIQLPPNILGECILHPSIVSKLFVQTLQTKRKNKNAQKHHTLKPLALHILQHIVSALTAGDNNVDRRMAAIRAFLNVHPSFDIITNTNTVSLLLDQNENSESPPNGDLLGKYFVFLRQQIVTKASKPEDFHEAVKFIDLLFNFAKFTFRSGNDDLRQLYFRHIAQMFMIGAFCSLETFKSDVGSQSHQDNTVAAQHLYKEMKERKSGFVFSYDLRVILSSRFFSLISDFMLTDEKAKVKVTKTSLAVEELSQLFQIIKSLEASGASLLNKGDILNYQDKDIHALQFCEEICSVMREKIAEVDKQKNESKSFVLSSVLSLILSLGIHMLHPGHQDSKETGNDLEEQEADEIFDEICDTIGDLSHLTERIMGQEVKSSDDDADGEENLMSELGAICINVMNSCVGGNNANDCAHLGGGPRLVRDYVQLVWGSMLSAVANKCENFDCNDEVLGLLLESICPDEAFSDPMDIDDDDGSDGMDGSDKINSDSNSDDDNDFSSFAKANAAGLDLDDVESHEHQEEDEQNVNFQDEDVELDPSSLENLLLDDGEVGSDDEKMLEHHEGADKALAQLIKLKQDARKAGRSKKEKLDLSNRLRCFVLLEAIFGPNMRKVLTNQMKMTTILPLLRTRTILLKSLESMEGPALSNQGLAPEKRALLNKISSFLDIKICKGSISKEPSNFSSCETLAKQIMVEMKSISNKEHSDLCSSLLVVVMKAAGGGNPDVSKNLADSIYRVAVKEWSVKRNSKLKSILFDTLVAKYPRYVCLCVFQSLLSWRTLFLHLQNVYYITHNVSSSSIAPSVLADEMVVASHEARSPYLKSEAFRILFTLFQIAINSSDALAFDSEVVAVKFCESMKKALNDSELIKAKRIRDVLNGFDGFLSLCNGEKGVRSTKIYKPLKEVVDLLQNLKKSSESNAIKSICDKMSERIENEFKEGEEDNAEKTNDNNKVKKKKKKKKKKRS